MIFLGDIASPNETCSDDLLESFNKYPNIFDGKPVIANLEGLIADIDTNTETPVLFNHPSVIQPLKRINVKAVSLANNHTLDIPEYFENTAKVLSENNIGYTGGGKSMEEAWSSTKFELEGKPVIVNGFCWDILLQHQKNPNNGIHVATINYERILEHVKNLRDSNSGAIIILKMHWSFDLETRPFPIYREFSRKVIDAGANAVIGSHSHCVQGAEKYKDGMIVYGLGNFYIPWGTFINGTIHFPEFSRLELALEWAPFTNEAVCHWFKYDNDSGKHSLELIGSEKFEESSILAEHTPYKGIGRDEYEKWFVTNRRKGFLLPVYKNIDSKFSNNLKDLFIRKRIQLARFLAQYNLREWNN